MTFQRGLRLLAAEQRVPFPAASVERLCPPHLLVKAPLQEAWGTMGRTLQEALCWAGPQAKPEVLSQLSHCGPVTQDPNTTRR